MTKRLQTLKDVESRGGGCGVLGRRKVALEKVRSSRVRKKCLVTLAITSSRSFNEIKMDDHMARHFDYGGVVG